VIPVVLTPAALGVRSAGPAVWMPRLLALVLLLASLTGSVAWLVTLSPFQLERWRAIETSHTVTISEPGSYVLFEEGTGAAARRGDPEVIVSVRSIAGRPVPLRSLIDGQGRSSLTYDVWFHQGRAIAVVDIDRPGRYIIVSFSAAAIDPVDRNRLREPTELPGLALGPDGEPSSWGTWPGLLLLGGAPGLAGILLAGWVRLRHPLPLGAVLHPPDGRRG
jgi:hypothetical protein